MSKPSTIKSNRISRDSGICVEDGDRNTSSASASAPGGGSESAVKKRFPAGGGPGRVRSSYVRRLTQHFENLTGHHDVTEATVHHGPAARFHSDWSLNTSTEAGASDEGIAEEHEPPVPEVVPSAVSACDDNDSSSVGRAVAVKEEKMDDAVQVIESIYEEILIDRKRSSRIGVRKSRGHFGSARLLAAERGASGGRIAGNHTAADIADKGCDAADKIEDDGFHNEAASTVEFAEEATETPVVVAEARNVFVSQEPTSQHDDHYYDDDDEFSTDTDSFDSTDDEHHEFHSKAVGSDSRPDSNSSIKSERITNIMKELLENEENYVQTLGKGIEDYVSVMHQKDLPMALRGQRYHIFGNIENIYQFHKERFLPKLRENRASIQGIAETFIKFIENDRFYCYILFALNRPKSEKICNKNLEFFQVRQHEVEDKLGLNSFLLQPIQRLPRYKLLLAEINKEVLKLVADCLLDSVKDEIGILCKAEKRLERFIDVVNEAMSINDIHECYEINLFHQGKFRKMFELDIYDWDRRRRYPGKIFFFEKCIIYTEKLKDYLEYRGHYEDSEVGLYNDGKSRVCVFARKRGIQEVEISGSDIGTVQKLAAHIEGVMQGFAMQERQRVNDLTRKKDHHRYEQRVPSVMTVNRGSMASSKSTLSVISNASSRESYESTSQTTWYVAL